MSTQNVHQLTIHLGQLIEPRYMAQLEIVIDSEEFDRAISGLKESPEAVARCATSLNISIVANPAHPLAGNAKFNPPHGFHPAEYVNESGIGYTEENSNRDRDDRSCESQGDRNVDGRPTERVPNAAPSVGIAERRRDGTARADSTQRQSTASSGGARSNGGSGADQLFG